MTQVIESVNRDIKKITGQEEQPLSFQVMPVIPGTPEVEIGLKLEAGPG
jgi:hypothetical protein